MWTRQGQPIALPDKLRRQLPPVPLDGELWAGHGRFTQVQSTVLDAQAGAGWDAITYRVFDAPLQDAPFEARQNWLEQWLQGQKSSWIRVVTQHRCTDREHLMRFLTKVERSGGEGVMLRAPSSGYQAGRSVALRKLKSFEDTEALVVAYKAGRGRLTGMVGSLLVELPNGTRFAIGSGLSDAERKNPPPIGSTITFKYYGWTENGKPRFPIYWRVRQ
jgi:DNA ligase-1